METKAGKESRRLQYAVLSGRLGAVLLALLLAAGCSTLSGRVNTLDDLYRTGNYREVVRSGGQCQQERPDCVKINLLMAKAHMNLGHVSQASIYADNALRLARPEPQPQEAATAYQIKGIAALRGAEELKSPDQQAFLLSDAESYLQKSLEYERHANPGKPAVEERFQTLVSLCETYVRWGKVVSGSQDRKVNDGLMSCARDLRALGTKKGIADYYFNLSQFRQMRKRITDAAFGGTRQQKELVAAELASLLREVQSWDGKIPDTRYADANRALAREISGRIAALRR